MKKLYRIIRDGVPFTPRSAEEARYFDAIVAMQDEDGLYTVFVEWECGECSVYAVREEGSPFAI